MSIEIREDQYRFFKVLLSQSEYIDFQKAVNDANIEHTMAMGTVHFAIEKGWLEIQEIPRDEFVPSEDADDLLSAGLPERRFLSILQELGEISIKDMAEKAKKLNLKVNEIIKWGILRGWLEKEKVKLILTEAGKNIGKEADSDEQALRFVLEHRKKVKEDFEKKLRFSPFFYLDELESKLEGIDIERVKTLLKNRPELAKIKERTVRKIRLSNLGKQEIPKLTIAKPEKNSLTSEDIVSGNWRNFNLRAYDVTLPAEVISPKKCHPLQKILHETRLAFLQMGFEETVSTHAELGFWDFDALFQPQDHPSRDMQDTFYLKRPCAGQLPKKEWVENVRNTHENGGNTGSVGWGYQWCPEEAKKMVLRTHTTANSIRSIANHYNEQKKFFCVGRVFRNETISFKHLPEFHQIDGIIIDQQASISCLLGTLQAFYKVMGFDKIKFKPAFFPYTEPSAEVFVWMEEKKCWIELGGSGIFRPEVTQPFGCKVPVMAWGLGLERLAMLRYGVNNIRVLYGSDLDWFQEVRLCQ